MFVKVKSFLKFELLFLTLLVAYIKAAASKNINIVAAEYEAEFYQEYVHYLSSKQISTQFSKLLDILSSTESKILLDDVPSAVDTNICLKCRAASNVIINEFKNRTNLDKVEQVLFSLCDLLTELSDTVCRGYANIYTTTVSYILKERKSEFWSTDEICGILYQQYQCGTYDHGHNFNIQPGDPILKISKKSSISTTTENLTIVHLTDFHYDSLYSEGSPSICTDEICCRNTSLHLNSTNKQIASKWGDYHVCDSPGYLVENICNQVYAQHSLMSIFDKFKRKIICYECDSVRRFFFIQNGFEQFIFDIGGNLLNKNWVHSYIYTNVSTKTKKGVQCTMSNKMFHDNIDVIYYTGDFTGHFQWTSSMESVKDAIKFVTNVLKNTFGSVPVIPVLGNHDTHPTHLFAPNSLTDPSVNSKWLFEFVANQWENWLPEGALTSLRERGYYTFVFRSNFRIIAMNNNVCYTSNLWLLHNLDSLKEQLQWLYETLKEAEMNNEKVHIIGHIPTNSDRCFKSWVQEYILIVNRFAHIISGQFNGHSHLDEFSIFYTTENPSRCLNVAWNGGSGTSFGGVNPNYRIYYADGESYEVLDHETWIFNLTEANHAPDSPPKWFKEYSFKESYQIPDLSPDTLNDMITNKWMKQDSLIARFWRNKVKQSEVQLAKGCDDKCIYKTFCEIVMCP